MFLPLGGERRQDNKEANLKQHCISWEVGLFQQGVGMWPSFWPAISIPPGLSGNQLATWISNDQLGKKPLSRAWLVMKVWGEGKSNRQLEMWDCSVGWGGGTGIRSSLEETPGTLV